MKNTKSRKKVIITGVTGQDGSYMVDYLLENTDCLIYGMVRRLSVKNHKNISHINSDRFELVVGDLTDAASLEKLVQDIQPDYVINFAANSFVGDSWTMPFQHMDVNALGVLRWLEAIKKYKPNCRFYSAGSSEEVGDVDYSPQGLDHPLKPRSPYGAAKCAAKHIVKVYRENEQVPIYAIHGRLYNHESPRRGEQFVTRKITMGVARIYNAIKNKKDFEPIELGNLDAKRDWSHAKDFVRGIWLMMNQEEYDQRINVHINNDQISNITFNIQEYVLSSDETHSVREFVELAFDVVGLKGVWRHEGEKEKYLLADNSSVLVQINPKFYRPSEVDILLGKSDDIRKDLKWKPEYSFKQLVEEMVLNDVILSKL